MKSVEIISKCKQCCNVIEKKDGKWGVRITCPYAENTEFLTGYPENMLNELCGHFKSKAVFGVSTEEVEK